MNALATRLGREWTIKRVSTAIVDHHCRQGVYVSKIQRVTVAERTTVELRQSILRNRISQGTPITEEAMSEELGVSRTTMRQALNTLMMEGLLTRHPKTRVLQVTTLSPDDVRDIYRARRFLELGGIDAANEATFQQREALKEAMRELQQAAMADDPEAFVQADFQCHAAVVGFLGSRHLSETHGLLMSKLRLVISQVTSDKQDNMESLAIHEQFTQQILAGQLTEAKYDLASRLDDSERLVIGKSTTAELPR